MVMSFFSVLFVSPLREVGTLSFVPWYIPCGSLTVFFLYLYHHSRTYRTFPPRMALLWKFLIGILGSAILCRSVQSYRHGSHRCKAITFRLTEQRYHKVAYVHG